MVAPFTKTHSHARRGLVSSLLHKLDIPVAEPGAADEAVRALLADAPSIAEVAKADIDVIGSEYGLDHAEIEALGAKVLHDYLQHAMREGSLSPGDRAALRHIVAVFGIPAPLANRTVKGTGKFIFRRTLAEACADGEISADDHAALSSIKRVLNLSDRLPVVGVDWRAKFRAEWDTVHRGLFHLHQRASGAKSTLDHIAEIRPDLVERTNLRFDIDEMHSVVIESDELIDEIGEVIDAHHECEGAYALMVEAKRMIYHYSHAYWRHFQGVLDGYAEQAKGPVLGAPEDWRANADHRRRENSSVAASHGFDPRGAPKERAWAIGIIAETVIGTPFHLALEATLKRQDAEGEHARRFLEWLRQRNAWWWIHVGQNTDLEYLYGEWLQHRVW